MNFAGIMVGCQLLSFRSLLHYAPLLWFYHHPRGMAPDGAAHGTRGVRALCPAPCQLNPADDAEAAWLDGCPLTHHSSLSSSCMFSAFLTGTLL